MDRNDIMRELAARIRESHLVAAGVVGYLAAVMTQEELEQALEYALELRTAWHPTDGHLALVQERYGPPRAPKP